MGSYKNYARQVELWRREYSGIEVRRTGPLNLAEVKAIKICQKCGRHWTRTRPVRRHHKGHEFLWAKLLPDTYAHRYLEFRSKDVVDLCSKCHKQIHRLYEPLLAPLWPVLHAQNGLITEEQAEYYRKKLVRKCNQWLGKEN